MIANTAKTITKLTTLSQVQEAIGQPLEVVTKGTYNVPGWPTVAMDRPNLLKWANALLVAKGAGALKAATSRVVSGVGVARAQYRAKALTRSQAQATRFAALLGA